MNQQQISERLAQALNIKGGLPTLIKANEGRENFNAHNMEEAWNACTQQLTTFVETYIPAKSN